MFSLLSLSNIDLLIYRDDLTHDVVSGNKLHKLAPNIEIAKKQNCSTILSFGGPYSNHLHALAWACKESELESIGVVRGELHTNLTPTLRDCQAWGMQLLPSTRKDYREYQEILSMNAEPRRAGEIPLKPFSDTHSNALVLPEGGSNTLAIMSVTKAYKQVFESQQCQGVTHAICATGTGATLAGLVKATPKHVKVIGIQAVAEGEATLNRIQKWLDDKPTRLTIKKGHLGGFGKTSDRLLEFIDAFELAHDIPLDPIYNGKAMLKISEMIAAGKFRQTDKILFFHTGGLQGKRSNLVRSVSKL